MPPKTMPEREMGFRAELNVTLDDAIDQVRETLKSEGFGILTTIDVRATLKEKIDVDFIPYVILGACNPGIAHRALTEDNQIGLLLPCNVTVFEEAGRSIVTIANPEVMLSFGAGNENLTAIAAEAAEKLRRVALALQ